MSTERDDEPENSDLVTRMHFRPNDRFLDMPLPHWYPVCEVRHMEPARLGDMHCDRCNTELYRKPWAVVMLLMPDMTIAPRHICGQCAAVAQTLFDMQLPSLQGNPRQRSITIPEQT